jgi:tetratricopeptide (TPR) repeat protein
VARLGLAWIAAFTLVVGPVADAWSSYYYTLVAVGAALLVGLACRRAGPTRLMALAAGLLWWHAAATSAPAFATARSPWVWTSHLTPFYFQRVAALSDTLAARLLRLEPRPEPDTRFFFAALPPFAGFQMGNGAFIRFLYRDASLQSHFYSQFSESTAELAPCRFLYWDGRDLRPLYGSGTDVFFQVGSDLLALERLPGARHAFRRGLLEGESRADILYWLGWTELWLGRRDRAEAAWSAAGARDDSAAWHGSLRRARQALHVDGDALAARRELAAAIRHGIGRPEAHALLGRLLLPSHPKYGLLELLVAVRLDPEDWLARRDLALELVRSRQDEQAWRELGRLAASRPDWRSDPALAAAARELEQRVDPGRVVREFRVEGRGR